MKSTRALIGKFAAEAQRLIGTSNPIATGTFGHLKVLILLVFSLLMLPPSTGLAASTGCKTIKTLPAVIQAPGTYCIGQTLTTTAQAGALINIVSDEVTLDLNGFTLDASPAGSATEATAIYAAGVKSVAIKNGTIKGFSIAISIYGNGSQNILVENVKVVSGNLAGIVMEGNGVTIRNNQIYGTGGSSNSGYGIFFRGSNGRVVDNDVIEMWAGSGANTNSIYIYNSKGVVVEQNRIGNQFSALHGIWVYASNDIQIVNNRISGVSKGIHYQSSTGKFRDNLTSAVTTPFIGGTNAGNNN